MAMIEIHVFFFILCSNFGGQILCGKLLYHLGIDDLAQGMIFPADGVIARLQVLLPDGRIDGIGIIGKVNGSDDSRCNAVVKIDQCLAVPLLTQIAIPESPECGQFPAVVRLAQTGTHSGGDKAQPSAFEALRNFLIRGNLEVALGIFLQPVPVQT